MLISLHLITLFQVTLIRDAYKPKSKTEMSKKQVMPNIRDLSRSLEIKVIWTFATNLLLFLNETCTFISFKSAVKHRQLIYNE